MKRSDWYKLEIDALIKENLPIEAKDYIQKLLERAILTCGTICHEDLK